MSGLPEGLTRLVITGWCGMLGRAVVAAAVERVPDIRIAGLNRRALDITDARAVAATIHPTDLVINCAGIVPGRADVDAEIMATVNGTAPRFLAAAAGRLVQVSTDCVFDGQTLSKPTYSEMSPPSPRDHYGRTKLAGEVYDPPHLTVRGSFIGLGERGLIRWLLDQPYSAEIPGFTDWFWNGLYVRDYAEVLLDLALGPEVGLVHVAGLTPMTKYGLLLMVAGRIRSDLRVVKRQGGRRHMVLSSCQIPAVDADWAEMLDHLEQDYIGSWFAEAAL